MRCSLMLALACLLTLATGSALVAAVASPLLPPRSGRTPSEADSATVHRFYEVLNDALLTGRAPALHGLVDPGLLYPGEGTAPAAERQRFQTTLQTLTSSLDGLQLTIEHVIEGGDEVVVLVGVRDGGTHRLPDLVAQGAEPGWRFVDRFRLADGAIVAFDHADPGRQFAPASPSAGAVLDRLPSAPAVVELNRAVLPPAARLTRLFGPGPEMLVLEAGTATVLVSGAVRVSRAMGSALLEGEIDLAPGDSLVVPTGTLFSIENPGQVPAILLGVAIRSTAERSLENEGIDHSALSAAGRGGNVAVQPLAVGTVAELPGGRATLALTALTLAPGAEVSRHEIAGAELLVVHSGRLDLTVVAGTGQLRQAGGEDILAAPDSPSFGTEALGQAGALAAGESAVFPIGTVVRIHNPEAAPLVLLVARIVPIAIDGA